MPVIESFDAIVIGSGQAGGPLATAFATAGRKTALVERTHVGGTCINEGCTPTKTMVASARVAYLTRRAADYGVHTGPLTVDMLRVRQRVRGPQAHPSTAAHRRPSTRKGTVDPSDALGLPAPWPVAAVQ